jgi:subtilase family serine protease
MERVTIIFKPTPAQQQALDTLLKQQTNPASSNYHKWLTPQEYADRFGLSQNDITKVKAWLQSQGLKVVEVAPSRTWIAFNGNARQISSAFRTQIHRYTLHGKEHYSNATEPSIPSALSGIVTGVRALNNFRLQPKSNVRLRPEFTSATSGNHFLAPDDLATIYNLTGLYNSGFDGTGQRLVVVGQTKVELSDINTFRSLSGLSANPPQLLLIPGATDPGIVKGDIGEAYLDLEWSGAVARNATILYVYAPKVLDSLQYAVEHNLAPVISMSYGLCELEFASDEINAWISLGQQANAQGITIVASTGDDGAADCESSSGSVITSATHGLAVDIPAALPYVTAVGGTTLTEGSGTYWNSTNSITNASALSYIPEVAWNDTVLSLSNGGGLSSGGGGVSTIFDMPTWQAGTGVVNNGKRTVPDISFAASNYHDGYLVCSRTLSGATWTPTCVNGFRQADGYLTVFGGTSAGAPVFAGLVTLLNQKTNSSQGNINPLLYSLAATLPSSFHDIITGDNKVPCTTGSTDCPSGTTSIGYSAGTGYDMATGLGTIDASALAANFATSAADFGVAAAPASLSMSRGASGTSQIVLSPVNGFSSTPTWTCTVASALGSTTCSVVATSSGATLTVTAPAPTSSARTTGHARGFLWWSGGLALGGVFLSAGAAKRRTGHRLSPILCLLLLGTLSLGVACGGGGSSTTSSSSSSNQSSSSTTLTGNVSVQAVSGNLSHSVQVAVTIN